MWLASLIPFKLGNENKCVSRKLQLIPKMMQLFDTYYQIANTRFLSKSYGDFRLHSYIPLQAGPKFGRTREISLEVGYALVQ